MIPETRYAWNGETALAYQVLGEGAMDLLYVPGVFSNVDVMWENSAYESFLMRLASFSRLIVMDRRGYGCSERFSPNDVAPLEVHADDALAVLDAVGSERAAYFSFEEGTFLGCLLAASNAKRVSHLILLDPSPCWTANEEITWEWSTERWQEQLEHDYREWGSYERLLARSPGWPERLVRWEAKFARQSQSPGAAVAESAKYSVTDIRDVLPTIRVPTLVVHGTKQRVVDVRSPKYVAQHVSNASYVETPTAHLPWDEGWEPLADEIEEFLTGVRSPINAERILTTVLFTDIVGSTGHLARLGDRGWKDLVGQHDSLVRTEIGRHRGIEIDRTGDGFLATFDGPARAVQYALAIAEAIRGLRIEIRAGVHTGEVELAESGVRGIAVHIGARVAALADGGEVLVSSTVKDLVAGSGIRFEDVGEHELKGVPDHWRLYKVAN